jgi:hypothetical protein
MPRWPAPCLLCGRASPLDRYVKARPVSPGLVHMPPSSSHPTLPYSFTLYFTCEELPCQRHCTNVPELNSSRLHPPVSTLQSPSGSSLAVCESYLLVVQMASTCVAVLSATDGTCWDLLLLLQPRVSLLCTAALCEVRQALSALHCSCMSSGIAQTEPPSIALHQGYTA